MGRSRECFYMSLSLSYSESNKYSCVEASHILVTTGCFQPVLCSWLSTTKQCRSHPYSNTWEPYCQLGCHNPQLLFGSFSMIILVFISSIPLGTQISLPYSDIFVFLSYNYIYCQLGCHNIHSLITIDVWEKCYAPLCTYNVIK